MADERPEVATKVLREEHLIARYTRVMGDFYARCTCGWITPPCESRQRAAFSAVSHRAGMARARAAAAAKERARVPEDVPVSNGYSDSPGEF